MLVIENQMEQQFLEKFTRRLGFHTASVSKTQVVADQLRDFFPEVVFASAIGKESKTVNALAKIKASRGIPKVVFVRPENDNSPLSPAQKKVVDGVLYSPIDPFKLIDVLAETMELSADQLRSKYKDMAVTDSETLAPQKKSARPGKVLLFDSERKQKYDQIVADIEEGNKNHGLFDTKKFKELQKAQAAKANDDPELETLKKSFVKTLFGSSVEKTEES